MTINMYYATCMANGPISVRMDNVEDFDTLDHQQVINDARTDAEDDLGFCGEGLTEEQFMEYMEERGYSVHLMPEGNVAGGWIIWGRKD